MIVIYHFEAKNSKTILDPTQLLENAPATKKIIINNKNANKKQHTLSIFKAHAKINYYFFFTSDPGNLYSKHLGNKRTFQVTGHPLAARTLNKWGLVYQVG